MKKTITLFVFAIMLISQINAQNWQEIIKATDINRDSTDRMGYSVSLSGNHAFISSHYNDKDENELNLIDNAGAVLIFEKDANNNWIQKQKIVASDRGADDLFGRSISVSGDYAIIGTYAEDEDENGANTMTNSGSAYIFEKDGQGVWNQVQKVVASDRGNNDYFGNAVAISGNYAIVGAHYENHDTTGGNGMSNSGSAYIYERNSQGVWNEVNKLVASDRAINDLFGRAVSISGNYALIGAYKEDEDEANSNTKNSAGSAYIFKRNAQGSWVEDQKLVASDRDVDDRFGYAVDISGKTAVIGAYWEDNDLTGGDSLQIAGSAYVFELDSISGNWLETQKLISSDREVEGVFGISVSVSNDLIAIGSSGEGEDTTGNNFLKSAGASYIFEKQGSNWINVQKINSSSRDSTDQFGRSIDIDGEIILIGSQNEDYDSNENNYLFNSGSAFIFEIVIPVDNGIEINELTKNINVYPNPSSGLININLSEKENYSININSIEGKSIKSFSSNYSKQVQYKLNKPGIYFINIKSDSINKTLKLLVY